MILFCGCGLVQVREQTHQKNPHHDTLNPNPSIQPYLYPPSNFVVDTVVLWCCRRLLAPGIGLALSSPNHIHISTTRATDVCGHIGSKGKVTTTSEATTPRPTLNNRRQTPTTIVQRECPLHSLPLFPLPPNTADT